MIEKEIIESKEIPIFHVWELLNERKKSGDLNYEQELAFKYAQKFKKIPGSKVEKLLKELDSFTELSLSLKIKLIDILPEDSVTLKLLIPKGNALSDSQLEEVLKIIKEAAK